MSVNYYLDSPDNDAGHIGKWGSGGYFIAKAPEGVNSFDEWAAMLEGHRIFAEHGWEHSPTEVLDVIVKPTGWGRRNLRQPRTDDGEWIERGVLFVRHEFC